MNPELAPPIDGPRFREQLIRAGVLVPAAMVVARVFWHDAPTLRLLGNEASLRESYLPAKETSWRPRWRHADARDS